MGGIKRKVKNGCLQLHQLGTTLTATISENSCLTRAFPWAIGKSVTPDLLDLSLGEIGEVTFTVTVVKGRGQDSGFITGKVCVCNSGCTMTQGLTIVVHLTKPSCPKVIASAPVSVSSQPVLNPRQSHCYGYVIDIPADYLTTGGVYHITAHVMILNHAGHIGRPFGPNPTISSNLPSVPTLINDTVDVDDTGGPSLTFHESGCQTYSSVFSCDDLGTNVNTARIRQTGQQATASVKVACDCAAIVNRQICVQANITLTPAVEVGKVQTFCLGEPILGKVSEATATECSFTVSQRIAVQIPLSFPITAFAVPKGIVGKGMP